MSSKTKERCRLVAVTLDEASIGRGNPDQEHERAIAIYDILEDNSFALPNYDGGPYVLRISLIEKKLCLEVSAQDGAPLVSHHLSLTPFRKVIRDYDMICESYYQAIRSASPAQIEAIDMGRRGLHNEAAEILRQRLDGKLDVDFDTARRLFTLIFALHWKG
ncbi:UPF0262 family protein [Microvirga solisilvae]|uniref:UPF0262 family protein n=1 Tax=Microvirga solisilvae TaxID=2919498 RepID=UPI001FAE856D|nr:UPF0262 family protein [Microvirga solisilvae]